MFNSIRAEFRKLLTVRSTYVIVLICLAVIALFAGYGDGVRATAANLRDPNWLAHDSYSAIVIIGLFAGLVGLLIFGHEYRYNGIMYTLTASNSRLKSLFAKFVVVAKFSVLVSVLFAFFSPLCTLIAIHLSSKTLGPQTFDVWQILWHCAFVGWGYAMFALIFVAIIRSQIGSIVAYLLIALIGENIVAQIFSSAANYLPFMSLQSVALTASTPHPVSLLHNITVSLSYIVVGLIASAVLFVRRDAN